MKYAYQGWAARATKTSRKLAEFTLARKAAMEIVSARTANRHRWARRES